MTPLQIRFPIWKTKSIGIAQHKVGNAGIDIEIMYSNGFGERIFPHVYHISQANMSKYPTQIVRGNTLRIVPINDLEVKEYR